MNLKFSICVSIGITVVSLAAAPSPADKPEWKNLKVIPKNLDDGQMERLMHKMTHELGVSCLYCHPYTKPNIFPKRVDFVTDELEEKRTARKMMLMTDRLNKKYFGLTNKYDAASIKNAVISCNTCHQGLTKPPQPHPRQSNL